MRGMEWGFNESVLFLLALLLGQAPVLHVVYFFCFHGEKKFEHGRTLLGFVYHKHYLAAVMGCGIFLFLPLFSFIFAYGTGVQLNLAAFFGFLTAFSLLVSVQHKKIKLREYEVPFFAGLCVFSPLFGLFLMVLFAGGFLFYRKFYQTFLAVVVMAPLLAVGFLENINLYSQLLVWCAFYLWLYRKIWLSPSFLREKKYPALFLFGEK